MSNSCLSPAAPHGGREPLQIKPVWCPHTGESKNTGSPVGHCNHPLSRSSQDLLCHWFHFNLVSFVTIADGNRYSKVILPPQDTRLALYLIANFVNFPIS